MSRADFATAGALLLHRQADGVGAADTRGARHLQRGRDTISKVTSPAAAVLHPPAADPGSTEDERRAIVEMMAKPMPA